MRTPAAPTVRAAATANATIPAYLTPSSRVRLTGTTSRLRRVPVDASPATASPAATETASGRKSGNVTTRAVNATKRPLPAIWLMNGGPSPSPSPRPPPLPSLRRIATAMSTGTHASATSRAWLRRRPNTSRSSERSNRVDSRRGAQATGRAAGRVISLVDIEALPRQRHEHVLEIGALDGELAHADAREHELAGDELGGCLADRRAEPGAVGVRCGQAQADEHLGRRPHVARPGDDDAQPRRRDVAQLAEGALGDEPAAAHHRDVRADLLDLREQVRRDEDRAALPGELADECAHLAGALRIEAVRRLVEHEQVTRAQQGRGQPEPLAHAEGVVAVALARRRRQPHPVERLVDATPRGARVDRPVTGVEPGQVGPPGQ